MSWIQYLSDDVKIIGDGERIDMWRKPGLALDDNRVMGCAWFARREGLMQHTVQHLGNDAFSYEFVAYMFNHGKMVDSVYELFVPPAYRSATLSELDTLLPMREVKPELGFGHVYPPL